jgi:hypothetical protein
MDSRQPHGRQLKRTPGRQPLLAKKESKDGQPSWKLGLIVYLRRLTGKKLAAAIAINGKSCTKGPSYTEANRHSEQDGRILKGR